MRLSRLVPILLSVVGCSSSPPPAVGPPASAASISITVIGPAAWPNPIYPDAPEIVIEGGPGFEATIVMTDGGTEVELPEPGVYRVSAITGEGGCFDTAGVSDAGNAPIGIDDGDTVRLIDTGEVCD